MISITADAQVFVPCLNAIVESRHSTHFLSSLLKLVAAIDLVLPLKVQAQVA
jgi:hypothetical protein